EEEETRDEEEESFDPIPRTLEHSEDDGNGEEDQGLRVSEEQRLIEEEEADELYRDVDINQGRGLLVSQDIEDSHVTLTPVKPDGQEESSSVSSFVTSMLNPISDADRVKSLEVNFSKFMQTNQFAEAVSNIPVAADLTEMELKKILIEKMEGNKEDVGMMMIRKDPPLDQTGGRRDEEKVGSLNQLALHPNQQPEVQAGLQQGLNLDRCQPVSLLLQRNLCRLPVRWTNPHIWCLKQVENGVIELYFVNTEYHLADLFIKALGWDRIEFLTTKLGMRSFTPETLKQLMNEEAE
nr:ribonuclease H [Tanacetum cinerariifolium]